MCVGAMCAVQVEKAAKKKKPVGRAKRRMLYNKRFLNVVPTVGRRRGPNTPITKLAV